MIKVIEDLFPVFKAAYEQAKPGELLTCTECCIWLKEKLGLGEIVGYFTDKNHTAKIGHSEGGHDFLILNDMYIVDFWYKVTYDNSFPLYIYLADAYQYYGDRDKWQTV